MVRGTAGRDLVLTADVIAPLVDDPDAFGAIAAANALSDVWAMGGEPRFALSLVFFPDDQLPLDVLDAILAAGTRTCAQAGVAIVGGHSVRDAELKYGLSVTGEVEGHALWSNRTARPGQVLVLTKPLGTGVILAAEMRGLAPARAVGAAIAAMLQPAATAAATLTAHGAEGCTDVTGFGLLGHLLEMLRASNVGVALDPDEIPALDGALALVHRGITSSLHTGNAAALTALDPDTSADSGLVGLLLDPQTAGGLLAGIAAERAGDCLAELRRNGYRAAVIGMVEPMRHGAPRVRLEPGCVRLAEIRTPEMAAS